MSQCGHCPRPPPRPARREKPPRGQGTVRAPASPSKHPVCRQHVGQGLASTRLALMRYWARLMLAGVPVMVIWRSDDPSVALAILI